MRRRRRGEGGDGGEGGGEGGEGEDGGGGNGHLWHDGAGKHAGATEQDVVGVVLDVGGGVWGDVATDGPLVEPLLLGGRQQPGAGVQAVDVGVAELLQLGEAS